MRVLTRYCRFGPRVWLYLLPCVGMKFENGYVHSLVSGVGHGGSLWSDNQRSQTEKWSSVSPDKSRRRPALVRDATIIAVVASISRITASKFTK